MVGSGLSVCRENQGQRANQVFQVHQAPKVNGDSTDQVDPQDLPGQMVLLDFRVSRDHPDLKESLVVTVKMGLWDHRDPQGLQVSQEGPPPTQWT